MIDQELRQRAEELYVIDGMTLEAVAVETAISERTIQNWSVEDGWLAKRREYRNAAAEIRRYTTLTKLKLIKDAMTSLDPQKVYAFSALERATSKQPPLSPFAKGEGVPENSPLEKGGQGDLNRQINTPQEAIQALQEAVELKLRVMLGQPDALSLNAIKELKQSMELLDGMKAKYGNNESADKQEGVSPETIKKIRRDVMMMN